MQKDSLLAVLDTHKHIYIYMYISCVCCNERLNEVIKQNQGCSAYKRGVGTPRRKQPS